MEGNLNILEYGIFWNIWQMDDDINVLKLEDKLNFLQSKDGLASPSLS